MDARYLDYAADAIDQEIEAARLSLENPTTTVTINVLRVATEVLYQREYIANKFVMEVPIFCDFLTLSDGITEKIPSLLSNICSVFFVNKHGKEDISNSLL